MIDYTIQFIEMAQQIISFVFKTYLFNSSIAKQVFTTYLNHSQVRFLEPTSNVYLVKHTCPQIQTMGFYDAHI